ncbi:MAG TPA: M23 family metallopeptidase [Acidimicrobiales bacterium]|nr:M23 family metallopeptidase [Acidimicrobiales bacterium]
MEEPRSSRWRTLLVRCRMPLVAVSVALLAAAVLAEVSGRVFVAVLVLFAVAMALYVRLATPAGPVVALAAPVEGRWRALNSPTTRVPSHGIHAWAQTYAVDLVHDPGGGARPGFAVLPVARRPEDFPGFGRPVRSPVDGEVVRAVGWWRDHWSRTSPLGLVYLVLESVRELAGPSAILGNHLVVRAGDGTHVVLAHLRRRSLRVRRGDRVVAGQVVAECGNSGNSSEPHLHLQAMDGPSVWTAAARPITVDGRPPPANGELLDVPPPGRHGDGVGRPTGPGG